MKEYISIDGKKAAETIPLRTLFYGEGLFETFRYNNSLPVLLDYHYDRMEMGAKLLRIPFPEKEYITRLIKDAIRQSRITDAYVKICLLSGGDSRFYKLPDKSQLLIIVKEYEEPLKSVSVMINADIISSESPVRSVKSLNYLDNIIARRAAHEAGFNEALFHNEREEITECSASNIFWFKDDTLYTPSIECGLLQGTTRRRILELANSINVNVHEGRFLLDDVKSADFAFITNSLTACIPISSLDGVSFDINQNTFRVVRKELLHSLKW